MPTIDKKTAALIALVLMGGGAGAKAWLHKNPAPTQRTVFAACEQGVLRGIACCEDMMMVKSMADPIEKILAQCGMVQPGMPDPFGVRAKEESDWDKAPPDGTVYVPPSVLPPADIVLPAVPQKQ